MEWMPISRAHHLNRFRGLWRGSGSLDVAWSVHPRAPLKKELFEERARGWERTKWNNCARVASFILCGFSGGSRNNAAPRMTKGILVDHWNFNIENSASVGSVQ